MTLTPRDLTVAQYDVLLCMLNMGACGSSGMWASVGELVTAHYGPTASTANQGRRQAMRNVLWNLHGLGLVDEKRSSGDCWFRLNVKCMEMIYSPAGR